MFVLSLLLACATDPGDDPGKGGDTGTDLGPDSDGDGVPDSADCDPDNNNVFPGNFEIPYNGVDDDCDGIDVMDVDGDTYDGERGGGNDCDDSNPEINPGHVESCYDGLDNNCDGVEAAEGADVNDCDGDGHDRSHDCLDDVQDAAFANPAGLPPASVYPGAEDAWYDGTDADCEGNDDYDQDADGDSSADHTGTDCIDTNPRVNPGMDERWNDFDDDCDGAVDAMTPAETTMKAGGDSGANEDAFGSTLVWLPDLNGDGRDDLAVGVPYTNDYAGLVYILPTEDGIVTPRREALAALSGSGGTGWGMAATSVTGADTLAVGSPWGESGGAVHFYLPNAVGDGMHVASIEHDGAGGRVANLADGTLLVGCATRATTLAVTLAVTTWSSVTGTQSFDDAAFSVLSEDDACADSAGIGDLDGDGLAEIVVTGFDGDANLRVYVAPSSLRSTESAVDLSELDNFGGGNADTRYGSLPDITGDGYDEAMISIPTQNALSSGDGRIWIINGPDWVAAWSDAAMATISGGTAGAAIRPGTMGDPDDDGATDLLIGTPGQGSVTWVPVTNLAAGGDVIPAATTPSFHDDTGTDLFGTQAWTNDVDNDGDDDMLVLLGMSPGELHLYTHDD